MSYSTALLSTAELGNLIGVCDRTIRTWVEDGVFPMGSVIRTGKSTTAKRIRIKAQVLLEHGWLRESQLAQPIGV